MQIRYSRGQNAIDVHPVPLSVPDFDTFERTILTDKTAIGVKDNDDKLILGKKKKRLPYIWRYPKDSALGRVATNVAECCYLSLDLDGTTAEGWETVKAFLNSFRGFAYTTASHLHPSAASKQRWRIVLATSRTVLPEELRRVGSAFEALIMDGYDLICDAPIKWDNRVYQPSQILFLPDERAENVTFQGVPVDVDALLASVPHDENHVIQPMDLDSFDRDVKLHQLNEYVFTDLRSALWHPSILTHAESYPTWVDMGNRLAWFKFTEYEDQVRDLWLEWSATAVNSDLDSAAAKWDSDALRAERTEFTSIFALAQKAGWKNPATERGYVQSNESDFDVIPTKQNEPAPLPAFKRDKFGQIEATIDNVAKAVMRPDFVDIEIRFDQFRDEIMFASTGSDQWQTFTDADYSRLRIAMERKGFKPIGRELIRDVVLLAADEQPFDSAIQWLKSLVWDGIPRIERFYHTHFGAEDTPYTRAVSSYMWTALAGRILTPGCKADMVPILVGAQGCGKSTGVAALSPDPAFFTEISFAEKDDDLARKMRGRLVAEIGELRGLNTKEQESIKAFVTRTHENWIPKYREFATQFPRRLVFIGTTNSDEFLSDKTGNRRWLPVEVGQVNVPAIKNDCMQLWVEAREVVKQFGGIQFHDAERLATLVHDQYMIKDVWLETVERWLDESDILTGDIPRTRKFLRASDVLREALNLDSRNIGKREEMRISSVLQNCGFKRVQRRINGKMVRIFEPV
ncbi:ATPase [Photorhabdus temperata]|uniref:Putative P-loop ATPase n=1 Tax=Photorhabdus temperata subsp. temperata Meg1 TaxID=1393735 RepID=A0A081RVY4_PHOTE|nr:VapE domain-containing protein [Photorhabdus temperata]KER02837.1 putative P-loop ATPase [Photorhabdus temperata subsp. temperata Meg1]MCT8348892.1 ATPase [Photorhabdus temperata]